MNGYGRFSVNSKLYLAHRWIFEYYNRPLLAREMVCHTCDMPECINPRHLFAGSSQDNSLDCIAKNRKPGKWQTQCQNGHPWRDWTMMVDGNQNRCLACYQIRHYLNSTSNRGTGMCGKGHFLGNENLQKHGHGFRCKECENRVGREKRARKAEAKQIIQMRIEADRIAAGIEVEDAAK